MSLKVTMLGTGVGIPQPGRSQAAVLMESDQPLLLDCGAGTLLRLDQLGISLEALDTVVLTHLHLDHVSDLLALANARYLADMPGLQVFGPEGTEVYVKIAKSVYPNLDKMDVAVRELLPMDSISLNGFDIFAEEACHGVTALAYRLEAEEKVLVYSGDTEPSQRVAALAKGADLLVHECSFPEPFDVTNHTTPKKLGNMLRNLGVKRVVLTHLYPQAAGCEDAMAGQVIELSGAPTIVGWDMMSIVL
ncbi:MAG TPA: MBL fold metallo-hydrolase [Methanothrix sp.]|jgi:ribonuclease Z|nr:MBL fold metallo-hydrolase [Methanothrix sp.]